MKATNSVGSSAYTATSTVKAFSIPGAPTNVTSTGGYRSITVNWEPPANLEGTVTVYRIMYSTSSAFTTSVIASAAGSARTLTINGLTSDNTIYYARVYATSAAGSGTEYGLTSTRTAAVPAAPAAPTLTRTASDLNVAWAAPTDNGGSPITGYTVEASTSALFSTIDITKTFDQTVTSTTLTGLTAGNTYYVRIKATNIVGVSPSSAVSSLSTGALPGAPTTVTATGAAGSINLTWRAPANTGGLTIDSYTVDYATDAAFTQNVSTVTGIAGTATTLTNLPAGTTYYARVKAINAVGASDASTTVSATTFSAPAAPTGVTATGALASISLSWKAGASGGAPITGYTIDYATDAAFAQNVGTVTVTGTSTTLTNMSAGTTYYVRIKALNAIGSSDATATVSATTFSAPSAPQTFTATPGTASISFTWRAPATNGGSGITGYTVTYATDANFTQNVATATAFGTAITLTGLTDKTIYYARVTASNAVGTSNASNTDSAMFGALAPAAPTGLTVTPVPGVATSLNVSWTAPNNNGAPITSYTVYYRLSSSTSLRNLTVPGNTTSTTLTSLAAGAEYTVRVAAVNAIGASANSAAAVNTPVGPATAPNAYALTFAGSGFTATWTAPTSNGGTAITGYTVQYATDANFTQNVVSTNVSATTLTSSVTGLPSVTTYYVRVAAVNNSGVGTWTAVKSGTTSAVKPDAVAAPTITVAGPTSLNVSWTAPANGGAPITSYVVDYSTTSLFTAGASTNSVTVDGTTTSTTLTGLTAGTTYYARVRAVNAIGSGPVGASSSGKPGAAPSQMAAPTVTVATSTSLTVSWTAATTNGSPVTGYLVEYATQADFSDATQRATLASSTTVTLTGLVAGTPYFVRVSALSALGASTPSDATTATPSAGPATPATPTATRVTGSATSATVTWTAPAPNGSPITGYTVQYATDAAFTQNINTVATTDITTTLTGLTPGTQYYVRVSATNSRGTSNYSSAATVTPATAPAQMAAPAVTVASATSLTVTWTAPATNGASLTGFAVEYATSADFTGATIRSTLASSTTVTLTGLTAGTPYYVRMSASNAVGTSTPSDATTRTPVWAPDAPAAPTVTRTADSATSLDVAWVAPAANGAAITGYTVVYRPEAGGTVLTKTVSASTTATTLTGLTAGTSYLVRVSATNSQGISANSAATTATPAAAPSAPAAPVVAVAGIDSLNVSWTAPAANGSTITGYTVAYATDAAFTNASTVDATGTNATVTGLTAGTTYYVHVTATNTVGTSTASSASTGKPGAAPDAPVTPTVTTASATSLNVAWTAPNSNGYPVTTYTVTYADNAGFTNASTATVTAPTANATLTGLTTGTTYYVKVTATNARGTSTASATSTGKPGAAPAAPAAPTVTIADATSLNVTWTAPAANGYAVTGYTVTYADNAGFTGSTSTNVTDTNTTLTGLATGTTYYVRVAATNSLGTSTTSAASTGKPGAAPAAPAAPTVAIASATSLTASWTAPAANGYTLTGYTVTYATDAAFTQNVTTTNTAATTATFTGLAAGTTYYVHVAATNSLGTSAASATSTGKPGAAPAQVSTPTVTIASATSLNVSWSAPAANGYTVTGYTVQYATDAAFTQNVDTVDATDTSATITGLTTGTTYYVRVSATNALGTSTPSDARTQIPGAVPATIATPTVTIASATSVDVSWTAPAANGHPITDYTVQYATDAAFTQDVNTATTTDTATTLTGLTAGTTYFVRVASTNDLGQSAWSTAAAQKPGAAPAQIGTPTAVISDVNSSSTATVTWTAPAANGYPITGYTVTTHGNGTGTDSVTTITGTAATVTKLAPGQTYTFTVTATNARGTSVDSPDSNSVTTPDVTSAPTEVTATVTSTTTANLSWTAPSNIHGSAITGYTVTATPADGATITQAGTATTATVTGLTTGQTYTFSVAAINGVGTSPSTDSAATLIATTPDVPSTPAVDIASATSLTASWTAPAANGQDITSYRLQYSTSATFTSNVTTVNTGTTATSYTITGLTAGTTYYVRVSATNALGTSAYSTSSSQVPGAAPSTPAAPNVTVTSGTSLTPTWTAPAGNGYAITSYTLQYSTDSTFSTGVTTNTNATSGTAITGLTTGSTYYVRVSAANALGSSTYSTATSQVPGVAPSTPAAPTATQTAWNAATLTWTAPAANGYAITGYTVTATPSAGVTIINTGTATTATITGLTAGTAYTFTVAATNALGTSPVSSASNTVTASNVTAAPTGVTATANTTTSATVSWTAPSSVNPITDYMVQYSTDSTFATGVSTFAHAASTTTSQTVTGLTGGNTYYFRVATVTAVGTGTYSTGTVSAAIIYAPNAPTGATLTKVTATSATASWTAPNSNGSAITSYTVTASPSAGVTVTYPGDRTQATATLNGLIPGTAYTFTVTATNAIGTSAASAASGSLTTSYTVISTFVGSTTSGSANGTGTAAQLSNNPSGLATDPSGNIYVADQNNQIIRMVTAAGVVTTLAGTAGATRATDATGSAARFNYPAAVSVDSTGTNLYVADYMNNKIRKVVISTAAVTTIAGTGAIGAADNATGTSATLSSPMGVAVDPAGTFVYVADTGNSKIRKVSLTSPYAVSTVAGSGTAGSANGTGTGATFNQPYGLVVDKAGTNLYVADTNSNMIRQIVISSTVVTTLAGSGTAGITNGTGAGATFNAPYAVAVGPNPSLLYVTDRGGNTLRQVTTAGVVTTIAGTGTAGYSNGTGAPSSATLDLPKGVAVATNGTIYVLDAAGSFDIRRIQ